tara:strand:+ start:163 stop:345 length:183 start_codon:yes stop_codon:yes gene_type:complete
MNEYKLLETTLEANLQILKMMNKSDHENKNEVIVNILTDLKKLCENVIPAFKLDTKKNLA